MKGEASMITKKTMMGYLVVAGLLAGVANAEFVDNWTKRFPDILLNDLNGIANNDSTIVCAGCYGTIIISTNNGETFQKLEVPTTNNLNGIAYGNGIYVAIGDNGTILKSENGMEWNCISSSITINLAVVRYLNNSFVSVGENGVVAISSNGTDWAVSYCGSNNPSLRDVAYGNGIYIVSGNESYGVIYSSSNGVDWNNEFITNNVYFSGATFGNNLFMIAGTQGTILSSSNGQDWALCQQSNISYSFSCITYDAHNGAYIAGGSSGKVLYSFDGTNWTLKYTGYSTWYYDILQISTQVFAVGQGGYLVKASSYSTWEQLLPEYTDGFGAIAYGNGNFIAVGGPNGVMMSSDDGANWQDCGGTNLYKSYLPWFSGIAYGKSNFVACGSGGALWTLNGTNSCWLKIYPTNLSFSCIAFGNNRFVAGGQDGVIAYSDDGTNWNLTNIGTNRWLYGMAYGEGTFVAVGSGITAYSEDGENWQISYPNFKASAELATDPAYYKNAITFGMGRFVAVGNNGYVFCSLDNGVTWTNINTEVSKNLYGVDFANGFFVAVGEGGVRAISTNGIDWRTDAFDFPIRLEAICYGNNSFVAVGEQRAIFQTQSDVPPANDYDGDGKNDPAKFEASEGWYAWLSSKNYQKYGPYPFLSSEGVPAPADYDGDGKADPAFYMPSYGTLQVFLSSYGYNEYVPPIDFIVPDVKGLFIPADYDGDGKADPAIYVQSIAKIYLWSSLQGYQLSGPFSLIQLEDAVPAFADYDGDGKTDIVLCNPTTGIWKGMLSGSQYAQQMAYGLSYPDAVPCSGDYDGDGKADPALWQISSGMLKVWLSSANYAPYLAGPIKAN